MSSRRSLLAVVVVAVSGLTACGAAAPPAKELADEMINTLDVSDDVKTCMHAAVADFNLTDEQAQDFNDLDDVAQKADGGNALALTIIADFQAALASCN